MKQTVIAVGLQPELLTALTQACGDRRIRLEHLSWPEWCASRLCVQADERQKTMLLECDNGVSIQIEKVAGLVSFDRCVPREQSPGVCQEDQDYLYSARQSAWLVMHAFVGCAINNIDYTMLQAHFLTLPHCYSMARQIGFMVPEWGFSSRGKGVGRVLATSNLTLDTTHNFSRSKKPGMLSVAFVEGRPVVVLMIGDAVETVEVITKTVGDSVPERVQRKLKILRRRLALGVMEVFFKVRGQQWVLHRISMRPEWGRWWHSRLHWACEELLGLIEKGKKEGEAGQQKRLFIAQHMRPKVGH